MENAAPEPRRRSLQSLSLLAGTALVVMVLGVTSALVLLTTHLHQSTATLRDSVASVRRAREAEIGLIRHEQAHDAVTRHGHEVAVRESLEGAKSRVRSPDEQAALDRASSSVERYFAVSRAADASPSAQADSADDAERALDALVQVTMDVANRARDRADWFDSVADIVGVIAALLMLATVGAVVILIRRSAITPMEELSEAIVRFSSGARKARAPERGVTEVHGMATRFNEMATTIEQQREARVTAVAGVAHDLRNPLGALALAVGLVDPEEPLPRAERIRHVLSVVRRQIVRLTRMVDDLVDAARIESGHLELHAEEHDLRRVVDESVELFRDSSSLHTIRAELPDEPIVIRCDRLRIEQTLNNLLSNAIKYSPRGGTIRVAIHRDGERATVSVSDPGIGIDASEVQRLWEPFARAPASAAWAPGVGLGLSSAKRIVEAHGGEIDVESEVGVGSTFSMHLPLGAHPLGRADGSRVVHHGASGPSS